MYCCESEIISNIDISKDVYELIFVNEKIAQHAKAGQFLHVSIKDNGVLMRRPISISGVDKNNNSVTILYQIKGRGTNYLSKLKKSDTIDTLGPLGNGFPIPNGKKCALVGGGIGIAPLYQLAKKIDKCDVYLGFRTNGYYVEKFKELSNKVYVTSDDGSIGRKGFITEILRENLSNYDMVFVCGPKLMMKKIKYYCEEESIQCYLSLEEKMGCGIGACLVCSCKTKSPEGKWHYSKVCNDGPVFNAKEVILDGK